MSKAKKTFNVKLEITPIPEQVAAVAEEEIEQPNNLMTRVCRSTCTTLSDFGEWVI